MSCCSIVLLRNVRNVRLPCCCDDRLGIIAIVLLANERLHILRTDNLHAVSECLKLTRPMKGAGTGFDDDCTAWNVANNTEEPIAPNPTSHTASLPDRC